jgi:predicted ArsR family transcriptional regulator
MHNTRQQIIEILNRRETISAIELSRFLRLTPTNIRHHLAILQKEGVIAIIAESSPLRRGRPAQIFALSKKATLHNLDNLASALLQEMDFDLPPEKKESFFKHLAERLVANSRVDDASLVARLNSTVQILNRMNYYALWEARQDAPRITFKHCPYATIISDHPELCWLDKFLLITLLNHPVKQTAKLNKDSRSLNYCSFTLVSSHIHP